MAGDYQQAIEFYTKSIEAFPAAEAYPFRGWTYSFLGDYAHAIAECREAIKVDPEFGNPYNDIGAYLIEQGKWEEAVPWFEKAVHAKCYEARCCPHFNPERVYEHKHDGTRAKQCHAQAYTHMSDVQRRSQGYGDCARLSIDPPTLKLDVATPVTNVDGQSQERHNPPVMTRPTRRLSATILGSAFALCVSLLFAIPISVSAHAQTYTVLGRFNLSNGADPAAGLIEDKAGNLYGTTDLGAGVNGYGTVFRLDTAGKLKTLHTFSGLFDGRYPDARLLRDAAGNLYGTASQGGNIYDCNPGCGVVFKIDSASHFSVLYRFTDGADGAYPLAELVRDSAGNLYGTASEGGNLTNPVCVTFGDGCGVVFKIDSAGTESVLYAFGGGADGLDPLSGLVMDASGSLYGTASTGGNPACTGLVPGCGVIFEIDSAGTYSVLYSFTGGAQGSYPNTTMVRDNLGNLYGTTFYGGDLTCDAGVGCGTVFKLDTAGNLTTLYSFSGVPDGAFPNGLLIDRAGNVYGTTEFGGDSICVSEFPGCGTIFKLDTTGNETILYTFLGPQHQQGYQPLAGLLMDSAGVLYGTANGSNGKFDGAIFKVTP